MKMSRFFNVLIGPELLWLFFYVVLVLIIKVSASPIKSMDSFWISLAYIIPLVLVPITFGLYYTPGVIRSWLILRILIVGIIGSHFLLDKALLAHTEQGPGVGTAYIMGMLFSMVVLFIGSVWAAIKF